MSTSLKIVGVKSLLKWTLGAALLLFAWVGLALFGGLRGWWLTPVAPTDDVTAFHAWARAEIERGDPVAGALLLLESGDGVARTFTEGHNENTLFPAASLSKLLAALAVHSLVADGHADLDEPVSTYLTRWQLPETEFDDKAVTLRRLLSHTSGLTDGLGFGDYKPKESVPTLEASLNEPRASGGRTPVIAQGQAPGKFLYSGGGYLVIELVVEELSGLRFAEYVEQTVFRPAGMTRSTYEYPGNSVRNIAPIFDSNRTPLPWFRYASNAATGLATTAADLARLAAYARQLHALRKPEAFEFGAPIWGAGAILYAPIADDFVFGHDGANDPAINSSIRINPVTGDAFVMLVSGHPDLATRIGSEWVFWQTGTPDILAVEQALGSALLPIVVGGALILFTFIVTKTGSDRRKP